MLFMLDNYDSFTYNLVQYFGELGQEVCVYRNNQITVSEVEALNPTRICLSPGPGQPQNAGIMPELIKHFYNKVPILGVCLGHQAIAQHFGAHIAKAQTIMHGKTSAVTHDGSDVFTGIPTPMDVIRYHSLAVSSASLPECLRVTARSSDGEIMGLCHKELPISGVQFHPESIFTEHGHQLLQNFLNNN